MVQLDLVSLFITSWFTFSSSVLSKSEELAVIRFVPFLLCTRTIMVSGLLSLVINLIEGGARNTRHVIFLSLAFAAALTEPFLSLSPFYNRLRWILRSNWWVMSTNNFSLKLVIVKTEHVIRNTLFIRLWLCVICKCSSCHCLIHDVMLCSQNEDLYKACQRGDVTRVKELLSRGAYLNYHNPGDVSCVWLCWVM